MGLFDKIKSGLQKTRDAMCGAINSVAANFRGVDEDFLEDLEEALIVSDLGVVSSAYAVNELRRLAKTRAISTHDQLSSALNEILRSMLPENSGLDISDCPAVILVIGVNGVGKTTTCGKLAAKYSASGKRVLLAAADTFRAAAAEQLEIWAGRANADFVRHEEGSDPAAVVFDAINAAKARKCDVIICDTAGRLHNKKNLLDELSKINRVITRELPNVSRETLLVLDATTGQNAVLQAKEFNKAAELSGLILTKLDGTAKGGAVISVAHELDLPVKFIGVGEHADDLLEFDPQDFVDGILRSEPSAR